MAEGRVKSERAAEVAAPEELLAQARDLVRRGKSPGDLSGEQQAALLQDRLARGELREELVRAAALAGHEGAARALAIEPGTPPVHDVRELAAWVEALAPLGGVGLRQATLALVRLTTAALRASFKSDELDEGERPALEAREPVEAWAASAGGSLDDAAASTRERLESLYEEMEEADLLEDWDEQEHRAWALLRALLAIEADEEQALARELSARLREAAICWSRADARRALERALGEALWRAAPKVVRSGAQAYSPQGRYTVGEVIDHSKFGQGKVVRALARQIEVEFDGGRKKLAHGLPR